MHLGQVDLSHLGSGEDMKTHSTFFPPLKNDFFLLLLYSCTDVFRQKAVFELIVCSVTRN